MSLRRLLDMPGDAPELLCRPQAYAPDERMLLARDLLAMANLDHEGSRWILVGVAPGGAPRRIEGLSDGDAECLRDFVAELVPRVEPALRVAPVVAEWDGKRIVAIELAACDNPPYVLRSRISADMRTGACWVRDGEEIRPARRADLEQIYARRRPAPPAEIGFGTDPACVEIELSVPDSSDPPSRQAKRKLRLAMEARKSVASVLGKDDTGMARLAHARIFGADEPFVPRGMDTLVDNYNRVADDYRAADQHYFFELRAVKVNFSLRAGAPAGLKAARIEFALPQTPQFRLADRVVPDPDEAQSAIEQALLGYPDIEYRNGAAVFRLDVGDVGPNEKRELLDTPLRLAVDDGMRGRKVAIRYRLTADNLREALRGRLKLVFLR